MVTSGLLYGMVLVSMVVYSCLIVAAKDDRWMDQQMQELEESELGSADEDGK